MRSQAYCCVTLALILGSVCFGACSRTGLLIDETAPLPAEATSEVPEPIPTPTATQAPDQTPVEVPVACPDMAVTLSRAYPIVTFVLDRSTSMNADIGDADVPQSRWQALGNALANAIPRIDRGVEIGALVFPDTASSELCDVPASVTLPHARGNAGTLISIMQNTAPGGATPTAVALDVAARELLAARASTNGRALVLATDGAPDCNEDLDVNTCRCVLGGSPCVRAMRCLDDERTVAQIEDYRQKGLSTYVVGIQSRPGSMFNEVLDAMAAAGGCAQADAAQKYYLARSEAELNAALTAISSLVGTCVFLTNEVIDPNHDIQLLLDGTPLATNQWEWQNRTNGELILRRDVCDYVLSEDAPLLEAHIKCNGA
jgi:hypothetical protein